MENNIKLMVIYGDLVMNKEDYSKYYIQGSDHYLIPKDVFIELFEEMENWREEAKELKEKYLNAVADYETTMFEKEQLNSLVNSCQEEIRRLKRQLEEKENIACNWKDSCLENAGKIEKLENQQKKFIEYLENEIKERKIQILGYHPTTQLLIEQIIETEKMVLSKYQEIIGGKE